MGRRIGINGFGSIGRRFFRIALERDDLEVVAVNDLTDAATLAHLLKYDSNYGTLPDEVRTEGSTIIVGDRQVEVLSYRDPGSIPWKDFGVSVVVESTGFFTDAARARAHIDGGGARRVIISAPATGADMTVVMGVNDEEWDPAQHQVISNASCTTNCLAPVAKVLDEQFGIEQGFMTTIHAYTNDQRLLDLPHSDLRRTRSAGQNLIPTSTGAARALHLVLPQLKGKLNGVSVRVPTSVVSLVDLTVTTTRPVSVDAVNAAFVEAAENGLQGILEVSEKPLVSQDFKGNPHSSIVDAEQTMVLGDNMVKVLAWYDNEWGYANRLVDVAARVSQAE